MYVWKLPTVVLMLGLSAASAEALDIGCLPSDQRVATLGDAIECKTINSVDPSSPAQIDALYDDLGEPWVKEGELTSAGTNALFTVDADSWGLDVKGQWRVADSFWTTYSRAVITMYVGPGGGNPDAFIWLISPGADSGSFSYKRIAGVAGGLESLRLFGSGGPLRTVPEPTVGLLSALGLLSTCAARRSRRHNGTRTS